MYWKITNIDGLSGKEEMGAVNIINIEREERLEAGLCPFCGEDTLTIHHEPDGPDDFTTEVYCISCNEQVI
jgi:hypothetical protein